MPATSQGNFKEARQDILRGVYEDNLRTVHYVPAPAKPRFRPPRRPGRQAWHSRLLAVGIGFLVVFAGFAYQALSAEQQPERAAERTEVQAGAERSGEAGTPAARAELGPPVESVLNTPAAPITARPELTIASLYGLQVKTIVIDPGHGGYDPGTVGTLGSKEKEITLDVARRVKERLEKRYGYRVLLTRENDEKIFLRERVNFANTHEADLFISIHVNWLPVDTLTVLETYYFGHQADEKTLRMAERENRDAEYSVAEFNEMLQAIGNTMKLQESRRLATSIQSSMYRNIRQVNSKVHNWGVKQAPLVVLLGTKAPSVLVEIACISNKEEEIKLNTDDYREKLAIFLEEGIANYLMHRPDGNEPTLSATEYATEKE